MPVQIVVQFVPDGVKLRNSSVDVFAVYLHHPVQVARFQSHASRVIDRRWRESHSPHRSVPVDRAETDNRPAVSLQFVARFGLDIRQFSVLPIFHRDDNDSHKSQ